MALDAGMIRCLTDEISKEIVMSRVDKIHQPEKDEIDLFLHTQSGTKKLLISASSGNPRINITKEIKENPDTPPVFCTLLRKHLLGGRIISMEQLEFERAVIIKFESRDEMGFLSGKNLICEIMGKFSNIILTDEKMKILGVVKPLDFTDSEKRQLLPGMLYEMPPKQDKKNPLTETKEGFIYTMTARPQKPSDKLIVESYGGIAPLVAREMVYRTCGACDTIVDDLDIEALWENFSFVMDTLRKGNYHKTLVSRDKRPFEFSFIELTQYCKTAETKEYCSASLMLDDFYYQRDTMDRIHARANDLFKLVSNAEHRLKKKMQLQMKELMDCHEKERFKQYADLITSNLWALKPGDEQVTLINYYSESMEEITIKLDKRLTPAKNAQMYYKKYNKLKNAEKELAKQIELGEKELEYIYTVFDSLSRATTQTELDEIRGELASSGYASKMKYKTSDRKKHKPKLQEYRTTNGYRVLCGKNNIQNDHLTFDVAEKYDYWFHVKNAPGSHVVLICAGMEEPPAEDFTEAAIIAATNSKLADGDKVTVDYTLVKNIKKPPSSKPGYVIYHTNYAAYVTPDLELCKKLQIK